MEKEYSRRFLKRTTPDRIKKCVNCERNRDKKEYEPDRTLLW